MESFSKSQHECLDWSFFPLHSSERCFSRRLQALAGLAHSLVCEFLFLFIFHLPLGLPIPRPGLESFLLAFKRLDNQPAKCGKFSKASFLRRDFCALLLSLCVCVCARAAPTSSLRGKASEGASYEPIDEISIDLVLFSPCLKPAQRDDDEIGAPRLCATRDKASRDESIRHETSSVRQRSAATPN